MSIKKNFFWDLAGKASSQIVSLFVSIVLARILEPEQFGLFGMALVVITISQVFSEVGLSGGIVQQKDSTTKLLNTVFYINIILGFLLFLSVRITTPSIASFYNEVRIISLLNFLSFLFIIKSISIVPRALLKKEMRFKNLSIVNLIAIFISGIVGISMSLNGYGINSLITMHLAESIISSSVIWLFTKWRPSFSFSLRSVQKIWGFSSQLFAASIIDTIFNRIDVLIIGKIFSPSILGFYTRATGLYSILIRFTSDSFSQVLFPTISNLQDDLSKVRELVEKSFHLICLLIFFLIGLLYLTSDEVIIILLTEKWLQTANFLKVLLLSAFAYPLSITMINILTGLGKGRTFLKLEIFKKTLLSLTYIIGFNFGIMGFLYCLIINRTISTLLNLHYGGFEIQTKLKEFIAIAIQYIFPSIVSYVACVFIIGELDVTTHFIRLLVKSFLFLSIFLLVILPLKVRGLSILVSLIKFRKA